MTLPPPNNNNGYFRGKTEATLESIAKSMDHLQEDIAKIKEQVGNNCPIGKLHSKVLFVAIVIFVVHLFLPENMTIEIIKRAIGL